MGQNLPPLKPLWGDETLEERRAIHEQYRRELESRTRVNADGLRFGLVLVVALLLLIPVVWFIE